MGKPKESEVIDISERRTQLNYDGDLVISTGTSRNDTKWKSKTMKWSTLVSKLEQSIRTPETHAEFMRMSKEEQTGIKDVGGFVGGRIKGGRRLRISVTGRQVLTLDADYAPVDFVDRLMDLTLGDLSCAMVVYSTHKHSPSAPRLRLVIPLSREVTPEEYEAVARKVAEQIGIDYFDDTTYELHRLMFWPSHSSDVEPVFKPFDAPFLDPDHVLSMYYDWTDVMEWPVSSRTLETQKKRAEKVEDPLTKKGLVGIFCRTYTITQAIEKFLPDVYTPTAKEDRWTYAGGSTFGGLVIYDDDRLAFSHHSTDPASMKDVNAFDLVRIHKFGHLDEGQEDKPMNRRDSWKAMIDLIGDDAECLKTKDAEAAAEFQLDPEESDWTQKFQRNENLKLKNTLVNASLIMENDPDLQGIRLNEMEDRIEASALPWEDDQIQWSDTQDAILTNWIARKYDVEFTAARIRQAVAIAAYSRKLHPVRAYLDGLSEWDGVERVDRLLVNYLNADDTLYTREVTRKTLVAAVARVYEPGCKFDNMLVLVGPQGAGKSSLFTSLAGDWFSDSLKMDMMSRIKDAGEQVQGKWIVEIGEMTGMKKADVETVKSFISRKTDDYRGAYAHYPEGRPRQCIIVGSTNAEEGFLRDVTGNRRFWPVVIKKGSIIRTVNIPKNIVAQIWAEAKIMYETGESLLLSKEAEVMAEDAQREAMEQDDRQGIVEEYLDRLLPENWNDMGLDERLLFLETKDTGTVRREEVSNMEIWVEALHGNPARMEARDSYAIAKIMAKVVGWKRTRERKRRGEYGRQRVYRRDN